MWRRWRKKKMQVLQQQKQQLKEKHYGPDYTYFARLEKIAPNLRLTSRRGAERELVQHGPVSKHSRNDCILCIGDQDTCKYDIVQLPHDKAFIDNETKDTKDMDLEDVYKFAVRGAYELDRLLSGALKNKANVTVHCRAGINRSVTVICAYTILSKLKSTRGYFKTNSNFFKGESGFDVKKLITYITDENMEQRNQQTLTNDTFRQALIDLEYEVENEVKNEGNQQSILEMLEMLTPRARDKGN